MKIGLLSDLHLTVDSPQGRIDNVFETQFEKLTFVFEKFKEEGCEYVLQAGDFFDRPNSSLILIRHVIMFLNSYNIPVLCVAGQHDIFNWNMGTLKRTGLGLLEVSCRLEVIGEYKVDNVFIQGVSWGQKIESCKDGYLNILIIHAPIGDIKLFPGHDLINPEKFLKRQTSFDLILCGDYHYSFTYSLERGKRHIINTGCLLRKTRSERDLNHIPKFAIYDTENRELQVYGIPIKPSSEIFKDKERKKEENEDLLRFVEMIRSDSKYKVSSFYDNLKRYLELNKTREEVVEAINDVLEEVRSGY